MKSYKVFKFLIVILLFAFLIFNLSEAKAVNMESSQYKIQFGNINIGAGDMSSEATKLSTTLGQLAANRFTADGYVVKAGFQYIHSIIPFSFSISKTQINFGNLVPNNPVTEVATLSASFGGAGQYQVTAVELGPLQTMSGHKIPDTKCDYPNRDPCGSSKAQVWQSNAVDGFGYNMVNIKGRDVPTDFVNSAFFRPFLDVLTNPDQMPAVVMGSVNVTADPNVSPKDIYHKAAIIFKVNIAPVQPAGSYQTIIKFVATPTY